MKVTVPDEMCSDFFLLQEIDTSQVSGWNHKVQFRLFPYDLAYFLNMYAYQPWLQCEQHIPLILTRWSEVQRECQHFFKERKNKAAQHLMKEGSAIFLCALFWTNGQPVQLNEWARYTESFSIKPVNLNERLQFILENPTLYPAFVQLGELFTEWNKQYAIYMMKKRLRS